MSKNNEQILRETDELFKSVMKLYWTYLDQLEVFIERVPESDTETIALLNRQIENIQEAIHHDMDVFDRAIQSDLEDLNQFQEKLKINNIYKNLGNNGV